MKTLRKFIIGTLVTIVGTTSVSAGGIPVIDVAAIAQLIETLAQWKKQLTAMKDELDSKTGQRGYGNSNRNNSNMYSYLPSDFRQILNSDGSSSYYDLNGSSTIKNSLRLFDITQTPITTNSDTARLFLNGQNQNAVFRMMGEQGYLQVSNRITQIAYLTNAIQSTNDPKAIAELQARIATEQGWVANEQAKLSVIEQMQAAQDRIRQQQGREIVMKSSKGAMPSGW